MKDWSPDNPKAGLMARKRAQILAAARERFLKTGYEGTSMEEIAVAADVSIMTLYRHAESKEDLFAAVIASACDPTDEAELAEFEALMKKPLDQVLVAVGARLQQDLTNAATVALMRTVIAEAVRFPQLAEMAYRSLVGRLEGFVFHILAEKPEATKAQEPLRRQVASLFVDQLIGTDMLRVLLGLAGLSATERQRRAEQAAEMVMARLQEAGTLALT